MHVRPAGLAVALALPLLLTACGSSTTSSTGGDPAAVAVAATDSTCTIDPATVASGATQFNVSNTGEQVTEVYVYAQSGDAFTTVVAEVENIGPGTSRDMAADLAPGTYEVACKPGQTGDGIRAQLVVTGDSAASTSATTGSSAAVAAREIALGIDASDQLTGADGQSAAVGETIEFAVTNGSAEARNFEVKRPDGSVAGEVEIPAAAAGQLVVDATAAGTWKLIVEGGANTTEMDFPVS